MTTSSRPLRAALIVLALALASPPPVQAAFPASVLKCRGVISKGGAKLTKSALKALTDCHSRRAADGALASLDCNDLASADADGRLAARETRFANAVARRCDGVTPSDALFEACPSPCSDTVPAIDGFDDVAACLVCLDEARVEAFGRTAFRTPSSPMTSAAEAACLESLLSTSQRLMNAIVRGGTRCQASIEKAGGTTIDECTGDSVAGAQGAAFSQAVASVGRGACADLALPGAGLQACADVTSPTDLALCVQNEARIVAGSLAEAYLELPATAVSTTTTTLPPSAAGCPVRVDSVLLSRDSLQACSTNADCEAPRTCDPALGTCRTTTSIDTGWTGLGHHRDTNDGVLLPLRLSCGGPGPVCGDCNVAGVDPDVLPCHCANDTEKSCDAAGSATAECPACVGGALAGAPCSDNFDCSAGLCASRCLSDYSKTCSTNSDCPGSRCMGDGPRCENGSRCSSIADCVGTCTANAACECQLGPPLPLTSGGVPICIVQRITGNVTGTVNVDTGASAIDLPVTSQVFLGTAVAAPCPVCGGRCSNAPARSCMSDDNCDAPGTCVPDTAGDGSRDGTCIGGQNDGGACEVSAVNAGLPAYPSRTGGAGYSVDCQPSLGSNISGWGLRVPRQLTTASSNLAAGLSCGGLSPDLDCPCLICSSDRSVACDSDADCAGQDGRCSLASSLPCTNDEGCAAANAGPCRQISGQLRCDKMRSRLCATNTDCDDVDAGTCTPSTCSSSGVGNSTEPNQCDGGLCTDLGGGGGQCTTGPDEKYCDAVLQADGRGIVACATNDDCLPAAIGVDGGHCTVVERRSCFPGAVEAEGVADPFSPVSVSTFCMPPTSSAGINVVHGLPGPVRERIQQRVTVRCAGEPPATYIPGEGGCP